MIWLQSIGMFALWLGLAFFIKGYSQSIRQLMRKFARHQLIGLSIFGFLISLVWLFGALVLVGNYGLLTKNGLTGAGLAVVSLVGAVFVLLQVLAASAMMTIVYRDEPQMNSKTSDQQ